MSRSFEHRAEFAHPYQQVLFVLTDEDELRERLAAVGGHNAELLSHDKTANTIAYRLRQGIAAEKLPGAIRSVHRGDLMVEREQSWQLVAADKATGESTASVSGVPGSITAKSSLTPSGKSTELFISSKVTVNIPVIGRKIEQVIAEQVGRLLRYEDKYTTQRLASG